MFNELKIMGNQVYFTNLNTTIVLHDVIRPVGISEGKYVASFEGLLISLDGYRKLIQHPTPFPLLTVQFFIANDKDIDIIVTDHWGKRFLIKSDFFFDLVTAIEKHTIANMKQRVKLTRKESQAMTIAKRIDDNGTLLNGESTIMKLANGIKGKLYRALNAEHLAPDVQSQPQAIYPKPMVTFNDYQKIKMNRRLSKGR